MQRRPLYFMVMDKLNSESFDCRDIIRIVMINMKRDLLCGEPVLQAKVAIRRIKEINFSLRGHRVGQMGWILRAERTRCEHSASSHRASAEAYQLDIDKLEAEKKKLLGWLAEKAPIYCARLERYKQWAVTSDGVMETWPFKTVHQHPLLAV